MPTKLAVLPAKVDGLSQLRMEEEGDEVREEAIGRVRARMWWVNLVRSEMEETSPPPLIEHVSISGCIGTFFVFVFLDQRKKGGKEAMTYGAFIP